MVRSTSVDRPGTSAPPGLVSIWTPSPAVDLIGRDAEIAIVADLLRRATDQGSAVLVRGDPGIGKSRLLRTAADLAAGAGWRVLEVTGTPAGTSLPFSGLQLLLEPVLSAAASLPPVQQRALLTMFGRANEPPAEVFLVAMATLTLLTEVAATRPVALVVDDLHSLDESTNDVLAFVGRRIGQDPIVIIGATRTSDRTSFTSAEPFELELSGLDDASARELLAAGSVSNGRDDARILRLAAGNPLALQELPALWRSRPEAWLDDLPMSLPLSGRLELAFAAPVTGLPPLTRDAILIAAVDRQDDLPEILAAASVLSGRPVTAAVLEAAEQAGVLHFDEARVTFRHPLIRSGVLLRESPARRQQANRAMSEVLRQQPYRRSWYRAHAVDGPDDDVADELERDHHESMRRGSVVGAISGLERAAQLTTDSARRGRRLLLAAQLAFGLGRADLVDRLVTAAESEELADFDRARARWLREIFDDGDPGDADRVRTLCTTAVRAQAAGDLDLSLDVLLSGALRCWWADAGRQAPARVVQVAEDLGGRSDDPRRLAVIALAEPILRARQTIAQLVGFSAESVADANHLRLLGMASRAVGDEVHAADFLDRAESILRAQGRMGLLAQVVALQSAVRLDLGDWRRAAESTEEAGRLARDTGQPLWVSGTSVLEARAAALRGNTDLALRLVAEVERSGSNRGINHLLACAQLARGIAHLTAGRPADAYVALSSMFDPADPRHHQREQLSGVMFLAEAALRCGRREEARKIVARLEGIAGRSGSPVLCTQLMYARPVLADDHLAEPLYLAGLSADLTRWPWPRARIQLAYGTWLRRQRRGVESREPLRLALATFGLIGATSWEALTMAELRASGERIAPSPSSSPVAVLTAQELQVARLAAAGLSNREIAEHMFLSPRTIASHLYRIFPKLGIRSRAQLAAAVGAG